MLLEKEVFLAQQGYSYDLNIFNLHKFTCLALLHINVNKIFLVETYFLLFNCIPSTLPYYKSVTWKSVINEKMI